MAISKRSTGGNKPSNMRVGSKGYEPLSESTQYISRHQQSAARNHNDEKKSQDDCKAKEIFDCIKELKSRVAKLKYEGHKIESPNYEKVLLGWTEIKAKLNAVEYEKKAALLQQKKAVNEKVVLNIQKVLKEKNSDLIAASETTKLEPIQKLHKDWNIVVSLYFKLAVYQRQYDEIWFHKHKLPWDASVFNTWPDLEE